MVGIVAQRAIILGHMQVFIVTIIPEEIIQITLLVIILMQIGGYIIVFLMEATMWVCGELSQKKNGYICSGVEVGLIQNMEQRLLMGKMV